MLDQSPDQRDRLRDGRADPANAVEELLRRDPPVQLTMRIAREAMELGGSPVPKGAVVILLFVAANHDPSVFSDPTRLDLGRANAHRHLTFGGGAHYCLGNALARMEGRILLPKLLRAFPNLRVDRPLPKHRPSLTIRGYDRVDVLTGA